MKREELRKQETLAYSFDTDGGHSGDLNAGRDDFIEGAKWTDKHPANFWHRVVDGDLPTPYVRCLFINYRGAEGVGYMLDNEAVIADNAFAALIDEVEYWAEIPKLPENNK